MFTLGTNGVLLNASWYMQPSSTHPHKIINSINFIWFYLVVLFMLHGTIKEKKITPRCNPGSVAAERNSFKKLNLKQLYKSKFIDCYTRVVLGGWNKFLIPKPLIQSSCLWRKTSQPCHFSPSGVCSRYPIMQDAPGVPGLPCD